MYGAIITRPSSLDDGRVGEYLMNGVLLSWKFEIQSLFTLRRLKMKLLALLSGAVAIVSAAYPGDIVQYWYVKPA
jgi:hypothetical protein